VETIRQQVQGQGARTTKAGREDIKRFGSEV
jgi:hypothetical protein